MSLRQSHRHRHLFGRLGRLGRLAVALCLLAPAAAPAQPAQPAASSSTAKPPAAKPPLVLPPLPAGVTKLDFNDFFKTPVGPYGLELTPQVLALDGKRVRILGYMVWEEITRCNSCVTPARTRNGRPVPAWLEATVPGRMMLAPMRCQVSHSHYGLADDLPPQVLFVTVPDKYGRYVPYTPGPMLLTGVLSVGNKQEPDGRISTLRLMLDLPTSAPLAATHPATP